MARPQTVTDEEILQTAQDVLLRSGHEGFTLSEVAREVGLSRAAIILRFESTQALKLTLTSRMVGHFRSLLDGLPVECSGDGLIALAAFIGSMIAGRDRLQGFFQTYQAQMEDEALLALELERGEALHNAISQRLPEVAIEHGSAVLAYAAYLGGCILQWQALPDTGMDASDYLVDRTRAWLSLAGVSYSDQGHRG